jgi:small-conductance mechanosensitive channel
MLETFKNFLELEFINIHGYKIGTYTILIVLLIILITNVVLWVVKKALFRANKAPMFDSGNAFALYQIIKYLVWVIAIVFILEAIGVKITLLLAGSAALLVGIGLGLQQTFNDFVSGIILLSEK